MSLADTQTITIGGTAIPLVRTGASLNEGVWTSADRKYVLSVKHSADKRYSHVVKLTYTDYVANPLVPAENVPVSAAVWTVLNNPKNGLTGAETNPIAVGFTNWLTPLVDEIEMGQN